MYVCIQVRAYVYGCHLTLGMYMHMRVYVCVVI